MNARSTQAKGTETSKSGSKSESKSESKSLDLSKHRNWLYATNNNNGTTLFIIILLLGILIVLMGWYNSKASAKSLIVTDKFQDSKLLENDDDNIEFIITPTMPNYQISYQDRDKWIKIMEKSNSDAGTVVNSADSLSANDSAQQLSTLYGDSDFIASYDNGGNSTTGNKQLTAYDGSKIADYATLESLGSSLTESLGGIKIDRGFAVISEILGKSNTALKTYDNTQNYKTLPVGSVAGATLPQSNGSGNSNNQGKYSKVGSPLFLQKDFEGVSNIFAPNIYITNPPLDEAGNPIININFTDNSILGEPKVTTKNNT